MYDQLHNTITTALTGSVMETVGNTVAIADFPVPVGAIVEVQRDSCAPIEGEVIGFRDSATLVFLFSGADGVRRGNRVRLMKTSRTIRVGPALLGRVIDAHGKPIDGRPQPMLTNRTGINRPPPVSTQRPRIDEPLATGVNAIDAMLTCGHGQRLGIFAGSGVGKSVLMGMMCKHTSADVIVIGLIGERGREVNDFLERDLGPEGRARSVTVVATSNEPALRRTQAALTATAVAEYFRDEGKDVLLLMDSVTRYAMSQREIGLSAGEPPTTRGYPPSVYSVLPKLVERAGRSDRGSITAFYTVLVEGDDPSEPVADTMRGLLDGHVWLSRKLAARAHYPAIDVLESISRVMNDVVSPQQREASQLIRSLMAAYEEHEDLISIGAYRQGNNRQVDVAIQMRDPINALLQQQVDETASLENVRDQLVALAQVCQQKLKTPPIPTQAPVVPTSLPTPAPTNVV